MRECQRVRAAAVLFLALPALAQAPSRIVIDKSEIRFSFMQMNVPVEGRFRAFDATVYFDPKRPEATKAEFEVDLASIDLGNAEGETEAKRRPWLNVEAHPKARYVSAAVKSTGTGQFEAVGPLTIKGVTRTITAAFRLADSGGMRRIEGQFPLRRLQFGIGDGVWSDTDTVADEITVRFRFVIPSNR